MSDCESKLITVQFRLEPGQERPKARTKQKDYTGCQHMYVLVDEELRTLECEDCGVPVDPISHMVKQAYEEVQFCYTLDVLRQEASRLRESIDVLKKEERNAKARVRRVRQREAEIREVGQ